MQTTERDIFHREFKSFMKDLIKVFPNDRHIKLVSSSLNIAMMDDPEDDVIKEFHGALSPCEEYIYTENNLLFTTQIIKSDIELFAKIGDYWAKLDDSNREIVWKYVKVLYNLSKKLI